MSRGALTISHMLFAYDSLFFFRVVPDESQVMKEILVMYEATSGQSISLGKSSIFFSNNIAPKVKFAVTSLLEVSTPLNTGRCLGLPSLIGRNKKSIFAYVKDRMWYRL